MNATKDSYLLNSKVAFLKSGQNAAGIWPFFYGGALCTESRNAEYTAYNTEKQPRNICFMGRITLIQSDFHILYARAEKVDLNSNVL